MTRMNVGRPIDTLEAIGIGLLIMICLAGLLGLIAAQIGVFNLPAVMLLTALAVTATGVWRFRNRLFKQFTPAKTSPAEAAGVAALLIVAALFYSHPAEYVVGGGDAGVYVNWAAYISRYGSLLPEDPITAELSSEDMAGFLRAQPPTTETDYIRFPGFYLSETDQSQLIPQFYPLQSIWLAIAYGVAGLWGALLMTPVWGMLGVLSVYLFARIFLNWPMALVAAILLMVNPLQLYFSRYPTAEPLTQYLMWTGLWSFTRYTTVRSLTDSYWRPLWGLTAGLALGLVSLARIDALPVLLMPAAWAVYLTVTGKWRREELWFWVSCILVSLFAVFHAFWYAFPYTYNTYAGVIPMLLRLAWPLVTLSLVLLGAAVLLYMRLRSYHSAPQQKSAVWRLVRIAGAVGVVLLIVYAYFIRPYLGVSVLANYWYAQSQIPISNHENLLRLGWYLTPLGIGLATAGFCTLILSGSWRNLWPWALVGGAFSFLYLYNILNNPFQIYAMRRYVPVVLPTFVVAAGVFLEWLWYRKTHTRLARSLATLCLVAWLVGSIFSGRLIWSNVEFAGASQQIESLASRFPDNAILLFVDPAPVGLGVVLGTPLQFLYDLPSYDLQEDALSEATLVAKVRDWQKDGYVPYILVATGAEMPLPPEFLTELEPLHITFPLLEQSYEHAPQYVQQVDLKMDIYAVSLPAL